MTARTLSNLLQILETNPFEEEVLEGLRALAGNQDAASIGEQPIRDIEMARAKHDSRGEYVAVATLLTLEATLVSEDIEFLVTLYRELARVQREELLDDAAAMATWKLLLEWVPEDPDAEEAIEELERMGDTWRDVADRFIEEAGRTTEAPLQSGLLTSAASLVWKYRKKGKNKEVDELFEAALQADPGNVRAGRLWAFTYRARKKMNEVGEVLYRVAESATDKQQRLALFLSAGRAFASIDAIEQGAAAFEQVQDFHPGHEEALSFLVPYFTSREMYDHLIALYEDALRSRKNTENEQAFLLQLGMVHWRMRNAPAEAEVYFSRLRKIDPAHPGMLAFYREYLGEQQEQSGKLMNILGEAQRSAGAGEQKIDLALEVARKAEANDQHDRAIDAWKSVQRIDAKHEEAREALKRLYRKAEKWNALAETLKHEADACGPDQRDRKLGLLRELVSVYRDNLRLDAMVATTYNAIAELAPEDDDAVDRLITTYEQMGRWNDLVQALAKKAEQTAGPEKVAILMRVAKLWIDRFANFNKATEPLEAVMSIDPQNREAIELLKDIYNRKRAWKSLFDVQLREVDLEPDAGKKREMRVELAKLAGEKLHKHAEAIALWREIVADEPRVEGALDALEKLGEREKDWDSVCYALERRIELAASDADRIKFLTKIGTVNGDQRKDPAAAAEAWKRVLRIEPKNGRALRTLRESFLGAKDWDGLEGMYAEANDWEGLVDVLGSTADRADDPAVKLELSFRSAAVYEDRIGEPARAFRSYERVLAVDPKNAQAATKLAAIYERDEKWPRLAQVLEVMSSAMPDTAPASERLALLERLRDLAMTRLHDSAAGFAWGAKAYAVDPTNDGVVAGLERAADAANAHAALASIYEKRLASSSSDQEETALRRRLAQLAGERLGRPEDAIRQLEAIVAAHPEDEDTVEALDRMFVAAGRHKDRKSLFEGRIERAEDPAQKFVLLTELANLEERELGDREAAATRRRQLLTIDPTDRGTLESLDGLLVALGQHEELASILDRRIEVASGDAERVALFTRLGDLRREKLRKVDEAITAYDSALSIDPSAHGAAQGLATIEASSAQHAVEVGRLLEPYYERTGRAAELSRVYERRLAASTEDDEKRELRLRMANLAATALGDPSAAYDALESAFLDHPGDVDLWDRLTETAEAAGRVEDLVKAFHLGLEGGSIVEDDAVELARRTASLIDSSLGRPAESEALHRRVLAHDAADENAFAALKELFTNGERWDDLQLLYRARIDATHDAEQKEELLRQVCFVFEEILDDPERAITSYRELLELDPEQEAARRALDKLYRRTNRHRDLLEILMHDVERAEGPRAVEVAYEIGTIHESRLNEPEKAVDFYERVLEQNPAHVKAIEALERLLEVPQTRLRVARILEPVHEKSSQFAKLARDIEITLEATEDTGSRVDALMRLASIREDRLRDRDTAFAAVAEAVLADPSDARSRSELARLADARRDHAGRAEVLEKAIATSEGYVRSELLAEVASLWDENVGDVPKAEAAYTRYIESDPENPDVVLAASRALERLHLASGDEQALAADLRRQVTYESDPSVRSALLVRLGDLFELSLDDPKAAIGVHRERLEQDTSDVGALTSLERLYARTEQYEELVEVLRSREALTDAPREQRDLAMRVAELEETKLGRTEDAMSTYADVVARFGRDHDALEALARLHRGAERWQDLHDDYEMLLEDERDDARRADLRIASAEILRTKLGETERALEAYADVLSIAPGHPGAIEALEDVLTGSDPGAAVTAARLVAPEFDRAGRHTDLVSALDVLSRSDDQAERLESLRKASQVAENGLSDSAQAFGFEARAAELALSEEELPNILARLEMLANETGKHREHAELLQRIAPDIMDADTQLASTMKVAEIARRELRDLDLARDYYGKALEISPEHRPALESLDSLLVERGDHAPLLETLRRKVEIAETPAERVGSLMRIADLCEQHLADLPSAIDALEQVLNEHPSPAAFAGLERLYGKTERHSDLAALYERMIDENVGNAKDVRHKLARVRMEHLGDADAALEALRVNLESGPHEDSVAQLEAMLADEGHRLAAASLLEPVFTQQMKWAKVVEVIEARLTVEQDEEERKVVLRRLGQIHEDYREDLGSAFNAYARLFREDIADEGVWEVLTRLARAQNGWEKLADTYSAALAEHDMDDPTTAKLAEMTGRLYDERVGDASRAAPFYARSLRFDSGSRSAFDSLESSLTRTQQWDALVDVYRERADTADSDAERIDLLHRLARVQLEHRNAVDEAVAAHRQVVEIVPDEAVSISSLDRIFTEHKRWEDLADLLRFRIDGAQIPAQRHEIRHRLGGLLANELDDVAGAIDAYEEVLNEAPHGPTVSSLEQLVMNPEHRMRITQILDPVYRKTDEWRKLVAIWEAQIELLEDVSDRVRLLGDVGRAHEQRGGDLSLAYHAWARAFVLDPADTEARGEVERIATTAGAFNELVATYEQAIAKSTDPSLTSDLLRAVASVHDERRGDPRSAIETYERLLKHDSNDPSPLDSLEALHTLVGDWPGLVGVLERKVELVYDGVERADLLRRAASVMEELNGDVPSAIAAYRRATEEDPQDTIALESLDRLLGDTAQHPELADVLERRLEIENDPEVQLDVGMRLAALTEHTLKQPDRAVNALSRVRSTHPNQPEMLASLARLYTQLEQWPDLLDVLRVQAEDAQGSAKVELLHRAGSVLEANVGDVHEAVESYRAALEIDPTHPASIAAMMRIVRLEEHRERAAEIVEPLLRAQGRWDDAAVVLSLRAESTSDPVDKRDRYRELAEVHEGGRGDKRAAFDAMRAALAEDASEASVIDHVERLGTELGAFSDVADAFAMRASSAPDPDTAAGLYIRVARIAEEKLSDDARAIEANERALEQVGDDGNILASLDRLYTRMDQAPDLGRILERRIDASQDPAERSGYSLRLGALRRDRFHDLRGAYTAFQEVLEVDPANTDAIGALEGLAGEASLAADVVETLDAAHRRTGALDRLPALFDIRHGLAETAGEKVRILQDRAALEERELHKPELALDSMLRAFELDPRDESLLEEVERLANQTGAWARLRGVSERILQRESHDNALASSLALRAAGWYLDRLSDGQAGEKSLRASIAADAETFAAHERLCELLRGGGRAEDLVAALVAWAEADGDEAGKKDRLREAAAIAEQSLRDLGKAGACYAMWVDVDGSDLEALAGLSRVRSAEGKHAEVAELLVRRIDAEMDPDTRLGLRRELAALYAGPLADAKKATEAYEGVLDESPTDRSAIAELEALYEQQKRWDDLRSLLERRHDNAENDAERVAAKVRLARLEETAFGRRAQAIEQLMEILEIDPNHGEALDELERLLAAEKKWDELVDRLERRIAANPGAPSVPSLERLAAVHRDQRKSRQDAIATFERIASIDPRNEAALRAIVALQREAKAAPETLDALERLLGILDGAPAIDVALECSTLADGTLGNAARAEGALRRALSIDAQNAAVRTAQKALYEKHGRHADLATVLAEEAEWITDAGKKVDAYKAISKLYLDKLEDPASAAAYLERASQLRPDDRELLLPLCDLYVRSGRGGEAVPVLRQIVASFGTKRTKELAGFHHRLGQALESSGDSTGALEQFDAAFKIDLTNIAVLRDLGKLTYRTGDYERSQKALRALLLQKLTPESGITKGDVYFLLGDMTAKAGDKAKAISMLDRAIAEDKGHAEASALLAQLKG